jgi:hypothetical protein
MSQKDLSTSCSLIEIPRLRQTNLYRIYLSSQLVSKLQRVATQLIAKKIEVINITN